jgi:adenylyl-sulfate kinase
VSGFVLWFTGLSGSGKSTLATLVAAELSGRGIRTQIVDGDEFRRVLGKGLGFSREDRDENVRRIGFVARLLASHGVCAITAAISPFRAVRDGERAVSARFVEVYCRAKLESLVARDPKGLYAKALRGEIAAFTGVSDPYEEPLAPEVVVDTDVLSKEEAARVIVARLDELGLLAEERALSAPWGTFTSRPAPDRAPREIRVDDATSVALRFVATGFLAPVAGPLGENDRTKVARERRLESGSAFPLALAMKAPGAQAGEVLAAGGARVVVDRTEQDLVVGAVVRDESLREAARDLLRSAAWSGAAGLVLGRPPTAEHDRLVSKSVAICGRMLVLACGDVAHVATSRWSARRETVHVLALPSLPATDTPEDQALLQLIVARNAGLSFLALDVEGALEDGRALLERRVGRPEWGLVIVAASGRSVPGRAVGA